MPLFVTALYLVAALVGASFALAEFRLLLRFVRHRKEVREAEASRVPASLTAFAELLVMAYCLVTGAMLIAAGDALWSLPLFLWGGCLGLVAHLQMTPQTQPA